MSKLTFERILAAYLVVATLLALLLPSSFAIEHFFSVDLNLIPFAGWMRLYPGALSSVTTYFFLLSCRLPLVVILLARYPQKHGIFPYQVPSLGRCLGATLIALLMFGLVAAVSYGQATPEEAGSSRGAVLMHAAAVSRLGLVMVGPLLMGTVVLVLYAMLVKVPRMWLGLKAGKFG